MKFDVNMINGACFKCSSIKQYQHIAESLCKLFNATTEYDLNDPFFKSNQFELWIVFKVYQHAVVMVSTDSNINDCYVCHSLYMFIVKCRYVTHFAIPTPMKVDAMCRIDQLPRPIQNVARYRAIKWIMGSLTLTYEEAFDRASRVDVNSFHWKSTPEGDDFWVNIYHGDIPANINQKLLLFDKEMYHHTK